MPIEWAEDTGSIEWEDTPRGIEWADEAASPERKQTRRGLRTVQPKLNELPDAGVAWADAEPRRPSSATLRRAQRERQGSLEISPIEWADEAPQAPQAPQAPGVLPTQYDTGYGAQFARRGAELMKNLSAGVNAEDSRQYWEGVEKSYNIAPTGTWEEASKKWKEGDPLGALSQVSGVIGDLAASSAADMVGLAAGPAYAISLLEERALNRAKNEGRERATDADLAKALPGTIAEIGLNYLSAGRSLAASKGLEVGAQTTGQILKEAGMEGAKAAGREGLTEAGQEITQIVTETYGTGKEPGAGEIAARLAEAGIGGLVLGGPLGFGSSVYNQSVELRQQAAALDSLNTQRQVEDFLARRAIGDVDISLAEDLADPFSDTFVGPLPEGVERQRAQALEAWSLSELELLGQEIEPIVRDETGVAAPVSAIEQGPNFQNYVSRLRKKGKESGPYELQMLREYFGATADNTNGVFGPSRQLNDIEETSIKLLGELKETFLPGMNIALGDFSATSKQGAAAVNTVADSITLVTEVGPLEVIRLNLPRIAQAASAFGASKQSTLANVLAHEFGHALLKSHYRSMPKAVRRALLNDYRRWLRQPERYTTKDFWSERLANVLSEDQAAIRANKILLGLGENWDYWGSFQEFFAEQVGRYVTRGIVAKTLDPGEGSALGRVAQEFKVAYTRMKKLSPGVRKEFPSMNLFLDSLRYKALSQRTAPQESSAGLLEPEDNIEPSIPETVMLKFAENAKMQDEQIETAREIGRQTARFNKTVRWGLTLPQIERENSHVQGVPEFVEGVRKWWAEKSKWLDMANETLMEARRLKVEQRKEVLKKFEKFVFRLTEESHNKGRKLKSEELAKLIAETRVTAEGVQLYERMSKDFALALGQLHRSLIRDAEIKLAEDPIALEARKAELNADFKKLANLDYFPLSRFGKYSVTVKDPESGRVQYFALWENEGDADRDFARVQRTMKGEASTRMVSDRARTMIDMPRALIERMKAIAVEEFVANTPDVTAEQIVKFRSELEQEFAVAELDYSPGQRYLNRMRERRFVPGFSEDALRSYASYMQSFANYIARLETSHEMLFGLDDIGRYAKELSDRGVEGREVRKIDKLQQSLREHYQYLMNPGNEFSGLRAFGAHWFLGFSPRAAFVNFVQVPTASYSWLAARYGDAGAVKELARGMRDLRAAWQRGQQGGIETDLGEAIDQGFGGGFLNESLATELGIYTEGGNLKRALPGWVPKGRQINYGLKQYMHYSMWMFQVMEKVNRLTTFTAAYRLARDAELKRRGLRNMDEAFDQSNDVYEDIRDKAFKVGREAVETSQGEYARWARPKVMQGKPSALFLFKLYTQHMGYFIARDPGRWRFLLMQLGVAGLIGLPGAAALMDLTEMLLRQTPEFKNKKPDVEKFVREQAIDLLGAIEGAPDLLLHGASRYGFGAAYPFDLSASLSLGNIVPGTDVLTEQRPGGNVYERAGRLSETIGGPLASMAFSAWKGISSDEINEWKQAERLLPKYAASASKALRWAVEGKETGFKGETVLEFDVHDPDQMLEILGAGLGGMQPRRLAKKREETWAQKESERFYTARHQVLLRQYWEAWESEDREAMGDVMEAIRTYNKESPPGLGISYQGLKRSIKYRADARQKANLGLPQSKKYKRLYDEVAESFDGIRESSP